VVVLDDSARTVAEAAAAVGVEPARILKSLVFVGDGQPVMVLCAGDRRVAAKRLGLRPANAEEARAATGFSIGGIPPLGYDRELDTLIDSSLLRFDTVWAAAGTPHAVFEIATSALIDAIPDARLVDVG
jgi:prolyl-tRNA editing enzyme YbaK/EbsC (Cys-tRNA(Pro) deacylase)